MLYVSPVKFEEIGFRTDLDTTSYPETTRDFLTAVPLILTAFPAFLMGLRQATGRAAESASDAPHTEA